MAEQAHPDGLPTPRSTLRFRYARVLVWCKACRRQREADLQALVDAGRGDVPLIRLRFRCSNCGSRLTKAKNAGPRGRRSVGNCRTSRKHLGERQAVIV